MLPIVIAPTYNNAGTLEHVLHRIIAMQIPLCVVNDGSTDDTQQILTGLHESHPNVHVLIHQKNLGKAAAMLTGFHYATEHGFTHAITIDTDAQHDPEEITLLIEAATYEPNNLIVGSRKDEEGRKPLRNRIGRSVSDFLTKLQTGRTLGDTQCGFRVYPLDVVNNIHCSSGRYNFETEFIIRAARAGVGITQTPITSRYFDKSERVSHFRPFGDSLAAVCLHLRMLFDRRRGKRK